MRSRLLEALAERVLVGDAAKGTALSRAARPVVDLASVEEPERVLNLHRSHVAAGAELVVTNTFRTIRPALEPHGLADRLGELAQAGVRLARESGAPFVAGSLSTTGRLLRRERGDEDAIAPAEAAAAFVEAGQALGQVDVVVLETMGQLDEVEVAVRALRRVTDVPIAVLITVGPDGAAMPDGTPVEEAGALLDELGVALPGVSCSFGPASVLSAIETLRSTTRRPLWAQPSAGVGLQAARPQDLAAIVPPLVALGVRVVGGCCGTGPEHLAAIRSTLCEEDPCRHELSRA